MTTWRKSTMTLIGLGLAVVLLICSSLVQNRMAALRLEHKLVDTTVVENAPPLVAFTTVALGSFRGLVADILWLRAQRMQEEGSYFEIVQLASWIMKLQPRFTGAAAYLAWNMSYNISVTFNTPEERWRWVQRGIEVIRDEALLYNPGDPVLFKELGWIYQHKLGQEMDDANLYYKTQLAQEMMTAFGAYPVPFDEWAEAPETEPALRAALGEASPFWDWLKEQGMTLAAFEQGFRTSEELDAETTEALREMGVFDTVNRYLRVRWLADRWKLDIERIAGLNAEYGDFDWRLPEAHAVYWASRGLEVAEDETNIFCQRMIFQSLHNAFRGGRLIWVPVEEDDDPVPQFIPNIAVVDAVNETYHESLEKHSDNRSIRSSHENFLKNAVTILYTFGRYEKSKDYYKEMRERYPDKRQRRSVETFVLQELSGDMSTANYDEGQGMVQGFLWQTCYNLALGQYERAAAMERIAQMLWNRYMETIGEGTHERRGLAPFAEMRRTAFRECLRTFPPELAARLRAAAGMLSTPVDVSEMPGRDRPVQE